MGADAAVRREMGVARRMAQRLDLAESAPRDRGASSGYCLSVPERQHVALQPGDGPLTLELGAGRWTVTWHAPSTGTTHDAVDLLVSRPGAGELVPPFDGPSVVLVERALSGLT